jgi:DNA-binding CsgD family transcriptional regulator
MELWQGLVDGRWSLLDVIDSDGRAFTVLHENPIYVRSSVALSERERQVAYLVGRGHHIKLVAYELGLSASTVRSQLRSALRKLNCDDRSALQRLVATIDGAELAASLDSLGVLALSTKPLELPASLSEAEREVARLVCDGLSNAEIAEQRGTATRTVANQLAAIYQKLDVDSRAELVRALTS